MQSTHLRIRDVVAVLSAVREIQSSPEGEETSWPLRLVRLLPRLIPGDIAAYNEMNLAGGPSFAVVDPDLGIDMSLFPVLVEHMHEHPLIVPDAEKIPVRAISDCISRRTLHGLGLYRDVYRLMHVEDQIAVTLPAPWPIVIGVTLSRKGWGFTLREREILRLLRPHLFNAQAAAAATKRLQQQAKQWKQTLDCLPQALIALSREGKRLWQTDSVTPLLDAYFPDSRVAGSSLPEPMRRWLQEQWYRFEDSLAVVQPMVVNCEMGTLIVRPLSGPDGQRILLLDEQPSRGASVAQLRRLGLSGREAEVLHGVMRGATDPQIGQALGISPRTVNKHVEHLLAKLGVSTRTAAADLARQGLGSNLS